MAVDMSTFSDMTSKQVEPLQELDEFRASTLAALSNMFSDLAEAHKAFNTGFQDCKDECAALKHALKVDAELE